MSGAEAGTSEKERNFLIDQSSEIEVSVQIEMRLLPSLLLAVKAHNGGKIVESSWDEVNEKWIDHDIDQADLDLGNESDSNL